MWTLKINIQKLYTKQKQTHRHSKQINGYLRREEEKEGQIMSIGLTDTNYYM